MAKTVLLTGGAGFIGSHVGDQLLASGWRVRALDLLSEQVHGPGSRRPSSLSDDVDLRVGDVRDPAAVRDALVGVDAVLHLAAATGPSLVSCASVNTLGTAVLLEALAGSEVERLIVASSMSLYGEGRYLSADGAVHDGVDRSPADLAHCRWDPVGPDGEALRPVATPEDVPPAPGTAYALTKHDQERMCLLAGRAARRPTVALRFFNTYGPRQSLTNPYSGVLAVFAARLLDGKAPRVFEDGAQLRDFVSVHDVARACVLALEQADVDGIALNVGSGAHTSVTEVACLLAEVLGVPVEPEITHHHRAGDVRHCFADVTRAEKVLGFRARVSLDEGLAELGEWLAGDPRDRTDEIRRELAEQGMTL